MLAAQKGIDHARFNNLFAANADDPRDPEKSSAVTVSIPLAILAHVRPDLVHSDDRAAVRFIGESEGGINDTVIDLT